jgi:hypothetical protein
MSKDKRDAEIDRICDVAAAAENTRLAEGGVGLGDSIEGQSVIEHEGQKYLDLGQQRDEYRETIEAPAPEQAVENTSGPKGGDLVRETVEAVRGRLRMGGYPQDARIDMGFLLEVIDAYQSGRM